MPDYTAGKARILLEPTARGFFTKAKAALRTEFGEKRLEQDVLLRPVSTRFRQDADAQLRSMRGVEYKVNLRPNIPNRALFRSDAKAQADTHLKGLYATMQIRGELSFKYADAQLAAWRTRQEAKPLKIRVITEHVGGVGRPGGNLIRREQSPLQPEHTMAFGHVVPILKPKVDDTDVKRGMERIKNDVERSEGAKPRIRPTVDDRGVKAEWARFLRTLQPGRLPGPSFRGVELLRPAFLSVASESAPVLVAALGAVTGAIEELGAAALAAPGALAVLGTSLGTMALGISGMKDAWKALSQQQDRSSNQATSDAQRYQQQQEQMRHGLYEVQKAQEDLTKARKDARRELEDLHAEERSSYLSVAEAALDLQEARNQLAKPAAGPLDYNRNVLRELKARESLAEAIRREGRVREDTSQADRKGIENSDRVRQAQEALVHSNEQVAETLRQIQMQGSGAANAADKVAAAMSNLSPNAAQLTKTLFDLKNGALNELSKVASQNMFAGMSDSIKNLVNADMPTLTSGFSRVSAAINRNFLQIGQSLNTDQNRGVLDRIFGNTAEFHKRINAAIDPAIRALGTLAAAGSNTMPRLGAEFAKLTNRFAAFIDKANNEGRLDMWINRGINAVESLGRSFGNIIRTLHSIGQAFGNDLLPWLERATGKMAAFFASGRGENTLLSVMHLVRRELDDWRPILQDLPTIFLSAMTGIRGAMSTILPIINVITSALRAFPGAGSALASTFITYRTLVPILALLRTGVAGVNVALGGIPSSAQRAERQIAALTVGAERNVGRIRTAFNNMGGAIRTGVSNAVGVASGALNNRLGGAVSGATNKVSGLAGKLGGGLASAAGAMKSALGSAAAFLGGPWAAAIFTAITVLSQFIQKNNDAAESADAFKRSEQALKDTLDSVTGAATEATRSQVAGEMADYRPEKGLKGNVTQAAEALLGKGAGTQLLNVLTQPGHEAEAGDMYQRFRAQARDQIINAVPWQLRKFMNEDQISDDNLVDAFLGDQEQVRRVNDWFQNPIHKPAAQLSRIRSLKDIEGKLSGTGLQAALGAQFLRAKQPLLGPATQQIQEANRTKAGGDVTLTKDGKDLFGSSAAPSYDGTTAKVIVNGDWAASHQEQAAHFRQTGGDVHFERSMNQTTITIGADDVERLMNLPPPPSRQSGGPSPELGMPGPTGGVISELHPGEWVLPKHARRALGDEWLWEQTKNKAVNRRGMYQTGGPAPEFQSIDPNTEIYKNNLISGSPEEREARKHIIDARSAEGYYQYPDLRNGFPGGHPGELSPTPPASNFSFAPGGPVPDPPPIPGPSPAPPQPIGESIPPPPSVVGLPGQVYDPQTNTYGPAGPAGPAAPTGGGLPGQVYDPKTNTYGPGSSGPGVNIGRVPSNATPEERAAIDAPGPTVDPDGTIRSPQGKLPSFGDALANAFLAPWGFKKDPQSGEVVSAQPAGQQGATDPGAYLGKWAGGFGVALGETLINGVAGFFGFNIENPYFQAFKSAIGYYSGKIGSQSDQYVDPNTQSIVGGQVQGYQTLVDPNTGQTYLVPTGAGAEGGNEAPLGDIAGLPPGKAPEGGLQPNAVRANRALSMAFPEIAEIGGVRKDPLKWHPGGLALDVMIPGGDTHNGQNPKGKALGDRVWAWMGAHAQELGIDMGSSLWQTDQGGNHYTHIHLAVYGKDNPAPPGYGVGNPGGSAADPVPTPGSGEPPADAPAGPPPLNIPRPTGPAGQPAAPAGPARPGWLPGGIPQGWHDLGRGQSGPGHLYIYPDDAPQDFKAATDVIAPQGWHWRFSTEGYLPPGIEAALVKTGAPAPLWPTAPIPPTPVGGNAVAPFLNWLGGHGNAPPGGGGAPPIAPTIIPGGGSGRGTRGSGVIVLSPDSPLARAVNASRGGGGGRGTMAAPAGEPPHTRAAVAQYIYKAARSRGYSDHDATAIVAYAEGESSLNPEISGGNQPAGGGSGGIGTAAGGGADVVLGLFQEKPGFAIGGGIRPEDRATVVGNVMAYLNQLDRHPGGDIYDRLLATSVGGPMYTGGRGAMSGLESRIAGLLAGTRFARGGYVGYYDDGGAVINPPSQWGDTLAGAGSTIWGGIKKGYSWAQDFAEAPVRKSPGQAIHDAPESSIGRGLLGTLLRGMSGGPKLAAGGPVGTDTVPAWLTPGEYVMRRGAVNKLGRPFMDAMNAYAEGGTVRRNDLIQALNAAAPQPAPPDYDLGQIAQKMAPAQPPAAPTPPRQLPPPPPQAQPMEPPPQAQPQITQPPPVPGAMGPAATPPIEGKSYEHPGLKQAVTSGAATAGNLAAAAAASFGGGAGGPLIAGLFQQAGKIANDVINVGAAFASGFLHFGGTTENPYGVMSTRRDKPPDLATDNRRVHNGDNYFASMDEWRRQNQLQDAQDMQAGMARMR